VKSLAVAVLIGLSLIAGAIVSGRWIWSPTADPSSASSWAGYEHVVRSYFALDRLKVDAVNHLAGPFYVVRYRRSELHPAFQRGNCALVDLSKSGSLGDGRVPVLWVSDGPAPGAGAPEGCGGKSPRTKSLFPDLGMGG
jgi:hypothetical protein